MRWMILWVLSILPAWADQEPAGEFDYYVLSLSWSPSWCAIEGDARGSDQCDDRHAYGWMLHGLWPQYNRGWPAHCRTTHSPPSRSMTSEMVGVMGSSGLAWHQWNKHGTCSGLSAADYFSLSLEAYARVTRPEVLRRLDQPVRLPVDVIKDAFLVSNPDLTPDMLTVICRDGRIYETRLCLSKTLEPIPCGSDVLRDCTLDKALLDPIR